jgi:hypothetical protein
MSDSVRCTRLSVWKNYILTNEVCPWVGLLVRTKEVTSLRWETPQTLNRKTKVQSRRRGGRVDSYSVPLAKRKTGKRKKKWWKWNGLTKKENGKILVDGNGTTLQLQWSFNLPGVGRVWPPYISESENKMKKQGPMLSIWDLRTQTW